jgi:hypothetical protein
MAKNENLAHGITAYSVAFFQNAPECIKLHADIQQFPWVIFLDPRYRVGREWMEKTRGDGEGRGQRGRGGREGGK